MTDNEKKFKAAFMALLDDYQNGIGDATEHDIANNYCNRYCPFARGGKDYCPAMVSEEYFDCEQDEYHTNEDKCRESIFNWYLERSND